MNRWKLALLLGATLPAPALTAGPVEVVAVPEFSPSDALIVAWTGRYRQTLVDLCRAVAVDDRVLCLVPNLEQRAEAQQALEAAGVDLANVEFLEARPGTPWIRDYGPLATCRDGVPTLVDLRAPGRTDPIPVQIALHAALPWHESDLIHAGGNHLTDGNGMGFSSSDLLDSNPTWTLPAIRAELSSALGIDSLVILPELEGDPTGHCDMYVKLLGDTLFAVGQYARPDDAIGNDAAVLDSLAAFLDALRNLDGRDFAVVRLPMNPIEPGPFPINRSYTNSLLFDDKVLVPVFGTDLDDDALSVYASVLPGRRIIPIDASEAIGYSGAVHCLSSQLHDAVPLVILHEPAQDIGSKARDIVTGVEAAHVVRCRLSPRFVDCEVELHYTAHGSGEAKTVPAVLAGGMWRARIPSIQGSFDYWFEARAHTDAGVLRAVLPRGAPSAAFTYEVDTPEAGTEPVTRRPAAR